MSNSASCFTLFSQNIDSLALPEKFTFPFYYEPQPLAVAATKQLQQQLETLTHLKAENAGKMFGVLVVQNTKQQLGFLSAYSGQIEDDKGNISFVPPVSSMQLQDDSYLTQSKIINDINAQIEQLENSEQLHEVNSKLDDATQSYQQALLAQQALMQAGRQQRKIQRTEGELELSESDFEQLKNKLAGQSIVEKKQLLALKSYWQNIIESLQQTHINISDEIAHLKKRRKTLSKNLQKNYLRSTNF
ncbi:tRNA pseudouridine32 synthase / 23S rRNA pseudouridine746 synthase [Pseudoalteromonas sp. BSi20429]|nr:tRNA pseudouridine32 synthase / 23S rRNA pseudouridine746 synthase [Pseudoalteromonas sp. BSi20429]